MFKCLVFVSVLFSLSAASTEEYDQLRSALPSPVTYYNPTDIKANSEGNSESKERREQEPRFGVQLGYGNDIQGYSGGHVLGSYTPLKIDLGGLVLGTVIGLGAVLLAPKLFHIFSPPPHPSGPYARSESSDVLGSIGSIISRIDEALLEHEIDTMACLQKAACSLVKSATSFSAKEIVDQARSPIFNFLIGGSKLKSALDVGLKGENCASAYPQCNFISSHLLKDNKLK